MKVSFLRLILCHSVIAKKLANILIDKGKPVPPDLALDAFIQEYVKVRLGGSSTIVEESSFPDREFSLWQSIENAPKDGTEIYISDLNCQDIVSWCGDNWLSREGEIRFPTNWQPLPDHPIVT